MRYLCLKDLATTMQLSTKSVMAVARKLRVKPTVHRYNTVRWSERDAARLLKRWETQKK